MIRDAGNNMQELQQVLQQAELIFDTAYIDSAINKLAQRLTERLGDATPLVLSVMPVSYTHLRAHET